MTKKQLLLKLSAYKIVIGVICLLAVAGSMVAVKAYQSYSDSQKTVVVEGDYIEAVPYQVETPVVGAVPGPNVYTDLLVHGRFLEGKVMGTDAPALSTSTADTITATQIRNYSGLDYTPGLVAMNITLPASSTFSYLAAGECMNWRFRNIDASSATSTTFVAGAGMDLVENENGDVVIEGGNEAQLKFCKELDDDITAYVDEYIAAD